MISWHYIRDCLAHHSAYGELVLLIASCAPAIISTKKIWRESKNAKGCEKGWRLTELTFLLILPVIAFVSTRATDWASVDAISEVRQSASNSIMDVSSKIGNPAYNTPDFTFNTSTGNVSVQLIRGTYFVSKTSILNSLYLIGNGTTNSIIGIARVGVSYVGTNWIISY